MIWEFAKLCEVAQIVTGGTPLKSCEEYFGGDIPWVRPPELGSSIPVTDTEIKLTCEGAKKLRMIPKDSVMVCCIGSVGKVGIAGTELATNQQINSLIFGANILPKFGYYHCIHQAEYFKNSAPNAVVPIINKTNFGNYLIPLPPLAEQHRIVEILDQADTLRQQRRQADALSQRILPALFHEMFGDLKTSQFSITELQKICTRVTDGTHQSPQWKDKGIPFLMISNIVDYQLNYETKKFISEETYNELTRRCAINIGDVLYSTVGSYGNAALVRNQRKFCFQRHIAHIKPDKNHVLPEFLWATMNMPYVREQADAKARGVAQKTLNLADLKLFQIILPPLFNQHRFVTLLDLNNRSHFKQSSNTLETLFQTLLHRAFDGSLTAKWREGHANEMLQEMKNQTKQ